MLVGLLVFAGCGKAEPSDPFVGSWRMQSGGRPLLVISDAAGEYTVCQGFPGERDYGCSRHYVRSGDTLSDTKSPGTTLRLDAGGEQLLLRIDDGTLPIKTATLTRLSDSTATPIPVP
jgi:hypothetical protein